MITCIICIWLCTRLQAIYDPVPNSRFTAPPAPQHGRVHLLAILPDEVKVTRRPPTCSIYPTSPRFWRIGTVNGATGGFAMTVGELKAKAAAYRGRGTDHEV